MITLEEPFEGFTLQTFYSKVVMDGYRPEFKNSVPYCYQNLIKSCWSGKTKDRPVFKDIVDELKYNEEFITDDVNKDEYLNYIDSIENFNSSF